MAFTVDYIQNGENNEAAVFNRPLVQIVDQLNQTLAPSIVPTGLISMWSGSVAGIPAGWVLCNGANGTPDLRGRFVVGAGGSYSVGNTGGSADAVVVSHTHTGTTASAGAHIHTASTDTVGDHTHESPINGDPGGTSNTFDATGGFGNGVGPQTGPAGSHSHSVFVTSAGSHTHTITTDSSGVSGANKNLPPYYALAYIMKT